MSGSPACPRPPLATPTPLTAPSSRCISCTSNRWTCQWVLREHACQQASPSPEDGVVGAHMVRGLGPWGGPAAQPRWGRP